MIHGVEPKGFNPTLNIMRLRFEKYHSLFIVVSTL